MAGEATTFSRTQEQVLQEIQPLQSPLSEAGSLLFVSCKQGGSMKDLPRAVVHLEQAFQKANQNAQKLKENLIFVLNREEELKS